MDPKQILLKPLETAVNQVLRLDPEARARLRPLTGRTLRIELAGLELVLRAYFSERGVTLSTPDPADPPPDASVRLSPGALLSLARSRGENAQGVEFRGDVAVVHAVRRLVSQLDLDWEEQLSKLTGDIVAHQIGQAVRGLTGWLRHTGRTFERNAAEYLTEESRQLPSRPEVEDFLDQVDRLRADADRLSARLQRLEQRQRAGRA